MKSYQSTPAEHAMNFLNDDFSREATRDNKSSAQEMREFFFSARPPLTGRPTTAETVIAEGSVEEFGKAGTFGTLFWNTVVLSERSAKNYVRNLLAYGVRAGMYGGASFTFHSQLEFSIFVFRNGPDACVSLPDKLGCIVLSSHKLARFGSVSATRIQP